MGLKHVQCVIIGSGFSGICMAIHLKNLGIERFIVYEKADDVGGTWRENTYPGVACDVPSHLYSFSFEPYPDWSKLYAPGEEIQAYIRHCVEKYDVYKHLVFQRAVTRATWCDSGWQITTCAGETVRADFLISAMGGLHTPNIPNISGTEKFQSALFHTSNWRHDVALERRVVGVIGTGATAVQCVPEIAKKAKKLYVFQRSPVWVGPKSDAVYSPAERQAFRDDPMLLKKSRWELWRSWETTGLDMVKAGSEINKLSEKRARDLIEQSISNPDLAEKLTPDYNFTCKRPTFSNDYYAAFERANVELVTAPIDYITEHGLHAGGRGVSLDVMIMATGFKPFNITSEVEFTGLHRRTLGDVWVDYIKSYKSIMVRDMPNLFVMLGPNSGGLTSTLQMIEQQAKYICQAMSKMADKGIDVINPKQDKVNKFSERVQYATAKTTHNKGCKSWWTGVDNYNHSVWPESSIAYKKMLTDFELNDFDCRYRG
jgi:cation diffusion facilitator CzcD-associated flavoprotein CzcO